MRPRYFVACGLVIAAGAVSVAFAISSGSVPARAVSALPPSMDRSLSAESPVDDVVPVVAEKIARLDAEGFGSIRTDYERRALTVFWVGDVPGELTQMVEDRPYGVEINVVPASYSRAELESGVEAIVAQKLVGELDIVGIDPDVDRGLTISTSRAEPFTDQQIDDLRKISGIPNIAIEYSVPPAVGYGSG